MSIRPTYETEEDRCAEKKIADIWERRWGSSVVKLPRHYSLDYIERRHGRIVAWLEIKRRHRKFLAFETVFFPVNKLASAHLYHAVTKLPCFFLVQFDDCVVFANVLEVDPPVIGFDGRSDRGDWQDKEPLLLIPVEDFITIEPEETLQ